MLIVVIMMDVNQFNIYMKTLLEILDVNPLLVFKIASFINPINCQTLKKKTLFSKF